MVLGICAIDYAELLTASPAGQSVYAATGRDISIASGRVSFALGMQGPCSSVDTACSAALVAWHSACRAVQLCECPMGLVMGVNVMLVPGRSLSFAVAAMTSPTARGMRRGGVSGRRLRIGSV